MELNKVSTINSARLPICELAGKKVIHILSNQLVYHGTATKKPN